MKKKELILMMKVNRVENLENRKSTYLNFIKIVAFLMVFLLHAKSYAMPEWDNNLKYPWLLYTPAWAGVWIFFIISGYGIGHGFWFEKYELTKQGILKYLKRRLIKVIPIYYLYIFIIAVFISPNSLIINKSNTIMFIKLILFQYEPAFDNYGFGVSWYICSLMKLYIIAPFIFILIKRILNNKKKVWTGILLLTLGGFIIRLIGRYIIIYIGQGAWHINIYKPFYMNFDLFFVGFLLSYFKMNLKKYTSRTKLLRVLAFFGLMALIMYNSYIYYCANILKMYINNGRINNYWFIYQYILPTIYIVVIVFNIWNFDITVKKITKERNIIIRKLFDGINYFAQISIIFYLFHANILRQVSTIINNGIKNDTKYFIFDLCRSFENVQLGSHIISLLIALLLTVIFGTLINNLKK